MELLIKFIHDIFNDYRSIVFLVALCFIVLDVITGYLQAIANNNVKSDKMRKGFWHKLAVVFMLLLAGMIDVMVAFGMGDALGFTAPIFTTACLYIIVMEITSILENITKMNPELSNNKIMQLFSDTLPKNDESDTIEPDGAAPNAS